MDYAIVINLDYSTNPEEECRAVWSRLRQRMLESGFLTQGRVFTTQMSAERACELARRVIDDMNDDPVVNGKGIYNFLKEFYGYDQRHSIDLLTPPLDSIELEEA
ncbi:MAG: hypothetical protein GWO16_07150 [Gammaproteobacteria bacterium]|nr:hypothetical protein [Gammaproteobacteria bacterium]NIR97750.1 hypothetical protein [Gammaproteobacteria bacterium]NIT63460.1 hypothetical protein [Gammaproteobacteria bacterium]NIV20392.1 hypothetical protein [Gammaproteobacteria bacterium]NIX10910.1 hypothetical protein [Gammaproteobacteria bacterium]